MKTYYCCLGLTLILFIVTLVTMIIFLEENNFHQTKCLISDVTYPKSIPTSNHPSNFSGFIRCDCGKRCFSDLGTCLSIYGYQFNENINNSIMIQKSINSDSTCTFAERSCPHGENLSNRIDKLVDIKNQAQEYENYKNNSIEIDCWEGDDGRLYLEGDTHLVTLIVVASLTGFFLLVTIGCYCSEKEREK